MQAVAMSRGWYVNQALMRGGEAPSTRLRWPLWCCAALSLAAHAVLLDAMNGAAHAGRASGQAMSAHANAHAHAEPDRAMRFRMVAWPAASGPLPDALVTEPPLAPSVIASAGPLTSASDVSDMSDEEVIGQPDLAMSEADASDATDAMDTPMANAAQPPNHGPETYIPRPELTVPPVPQSTVVLAAPEGGDEPARRVAVLSLFIDETGRVHHIVPDEPRLPPSYEQAAREAFMTAAFTPGQLEGRTVKSRIRVEVVFDNTPLGEP
jgi:hypothetical protein